MAERGEAVEEQAVRDGAAIYSLETESAATEEVPPGYKRTEVGVIPEDWRCLAILNVAKLESGHTPNKQIHRYWNGAIPWVSLHDTENLDQPSIFSTIQTISEDGLANSSARLLPSETVVFSRTATVGKSTILARPMATSQDFANYICGPELYSNFLMYLLRGMGETWRKLMAGSTHNTVYMPAFRKLRIPLPALYEQRAIATALSDADALIESLDRLIAKKRAIKQATMQQLLTGQARLPGFTGEWETKRLGEISTIAMGRTPSRNNTAFWGHGHVWLSIADLRGKVVSESKEQITDLAAVGMAPIPEGTLLMSFKLSIGRLCFAGCDLFTNEAICSFTNLQADAEFIYYALSRTDFSIYGKQAVKGYTLNSESLKLVEVLLPPDDEQTAIATVLSDMDAEIEALERSRDKARKTKQGMMQQLLTGRARLVEAGMNTEG